MKTKDLIRLLSQQDPEKCIRTGIYSEPQEPQEAIRIIDDEVIVFIPGEVIVIDETLSEGMYKA